MKVEDALVFTTEWADGSKGELYCHVENDKVQYFVCCPADSEDKIKIALLEEIAFGDNLHDIFQAMAIYRDIIKLGIKKFDED